MNLGQFITHILDNKPPPEQRMGQWQFNELHRVNPDLANKVRTSVADPFYDDGRLKVFWNFLYHNWTDQ